MNSQMPVAPVVADEFELVRVQDIPTLQVQLIESKHRQTGAVHFHLACENSENVFMVAFRTQPMNSRGVAHVLEHTVLCGSRKYPVRDPFFSMIKRSLNTFMNAFTAADWTAYPFATQNTTDFYNLLSVYLDAVFFPNIHPLDFAQEGIRVELEDGQPVYKGIVFNEMKGAMSAPTDQVYHQIAHHLYEQTTYHHNSGGDPAVIPQLTHEELVEFHQYHYHPSNAVLMSYGNLPLAQLQKTVHEQALASFNAGDCLHSVAESRFAAPKQITESYAYDGRDLSHKTYLTLTWLLGASQDIQTRLALRLVEGLLMETSASPLQHYVETCGLGESPSPFMGLDDDHFEMTFYCGLQGSKAEHMDEFRLGVLAILKQATQTPFSNESIEAVLHQIELQQREVTGGRMPFGLTLLLNGLSSAIHGGDPLDVWDIDTHLAILRQKLTNPDWLPAFIKQQFIDNTHRLDLILTPDSQKQAQLQIDEQAQLAALAKTLDDTKRAAILACSEQLAQRQAMIDDVTILPEVGLSDIPSSIHTVTGRTDHTHVAPVSVYEAGTNGLYYVQLLITAEAQLLQDPIFHLYMGLIGDVGAGDMSYLAVQEALQAVCGGVSFALSTRSHYANVEQLGSVMVLSSKALVRKPEALALMKLSFEAARFDEQERIIELLQQRYAAWEAKIAGSGHLYALQTATAAFSPLAQIEEQMNGLPGLQWLKQCVERLKSDAAYPAVFMEKLRHIHQRVLQLPKQFVLVAQSQSVNMLSQELSQRWLNDLAESSSVKTSTVFTLPKPSIDVIERAWLAPVNVYFCALVFPAVAAEHPDAAALQVLGPYLRNGFLHRAIREQGGAYGAGAGFDANAAAFHFYSYRDPRLSETFADFHASVAWLLEEKQEARFLTEAILNIIAALDKPGSPAGEAISHHLMRWHGRSDEMRTQHRAAILAVTLADLRHVAQQYLLAGNARRSVLAPMNQKEALETLGFSTVVV